MRANLLRKQTRAVRVYCALSYAHARGSTLCTPHAHTLHTHWSMTLCTHAAHREGGRQREEEEAGAEAGRKGPRLRP
eukprot:1195287-Rhodomonas_salina.1